MEQERVQPLGEVHRRERSKEQRCLRVALLSGRTQHNNKHYMERHEADQPGLRLVHRMHEGIYNSKATISNDTVVPCVLNFMYFLGDS
jgi:hypothetical protein